MWSMESAEYGKCGVWKMRSVENVEYSVWKCINFFIQHVSYSKVTDIKTNVFLSVLRFAAVIVESYKESLETLAL